MSRVAALILALCLSFCAAHLYADGPFRTVALAGQPVPGFSSGFQFDYFETVPTINNSGQVALNGRVRFGDAGYPQGYGVWSEGGGGLSVIAHSGIPAPGAAIDDTFAACTDVVMNNLGKSIFFGRLDRWTDYGRMDGTWTDRDGSVELVIRQGEHAAGMPSNYVYDYSRALLINDAGKIVLLYQFDDKVDGISHEENLGIWSVDDASPVLIARTGGAVPDISGAAYKDLRNVRLSNAGRVAYWGQLQSGSGGVSTTNDTGIWSDRGGALSAIVREGDAAPGTSDGTRFRGISQFFSFNQSGRISFWGSVQRNTADPIAYGIWSDRNGPISLVARSGTHAPDTPPDAVFSGFSSGPIMNDTGLIAFTASLDIGKGGVIGGKQLNPPRNDLGIWLDDGGTQKLLARLGDHAPGLPDGAYFAGFSDLILNNLGQVAFFGSAFLNNGTATPEYWKGIWATDRDGILRLIIRTGETIDVDNGPGVDLRTVSFPLYPPISGTGQGGVRSFNDLGQIAFLAALGGGATGQFVANLVAVPEPNMTPVLAVAILAAFRRSWKLRSRKDYWGRESLSTM